MGQLGLGMSRQESLDERPGWEVPDHRKGDPTRMGAIFGRE